MQIDTARGGAAPVYQPATVGNHDGQQVGQVAEQVQQDIREPGTHDATGIVDACHGTAVGPARIGRVIAGEGDQQVDGQCTENQQRAFTQPAGDLVG